MKKSTIVLLHVAYWLIYLFVVGFLNYITVDAPFSMDGDLFAIIAVAITTGSISFYVFYFQLVPRFLFKKKFLLFALLGIAVSVVVSILPALVLSIFFYYYFSFITEAKVIISVMVQYTLLALFNGVMAALIRIAITWYKDVRTKEILELALVKSRFDPHFLFNTLNNIDVLIERDAQRASAYLKKLSDLLRFMLHEEHILLEQEVDYIEKYLELQRIRTSNEQYIKWEVSGETGGLMIAPMLLIPFIENAFKHVTGKKINDAISIRLVVRGEEIDFTCSNVFDPARPAMKDKHGLGLSLMRQRLELLYKDQYTLTISAPDDIFSVNCIIRLKSNELHHH
ncbi:hypothetical protein GFS24_25265 [Chitinophaga sp. SYP-B3965]|uniref:sensor histidine kinase n=1 Tax=Chitinophaga sp. SYP-B3965 TaxID=2663120 RepID=UPI001299C118|nr:sensor histidine kinase [Chitinophaga sp. SYP-B3965]MRG48450.1 hypothetical protein [Chitinophaga sp. SYP-B3965]